MHVLSCHSRGLMAWIVIDRGTPVFSRLCTIVVSSWLQRALSLFIYRTCCPEPVMGRGNILTLIQFVPLIMRFSRLVPGSHSIATSTNRIAPCLYLWLVGFPISRILYHRQGVRGLLACL